MDQVQLRPARADDASAIAALHADSWRRHYRGAYSDAFLDGDVVADRSVVWRERLHQPVGPQRTIVAESGGALVGFAHVVLDDDETWGALLDNLHVAATWQRRGVGTGLLRRTAEVVLDARPSAGLYLWVLEQNDAAQRFYAACGGRAVETTAVPPVGGVPGRLTGTPMRLRYVWADPGVLGRGVTSATAPRRRADR